MGIKDMADKAKDALKGHGDKADNVVEEAGDRVDEKTGGKYEGHVDKGQQAAKDAIEKNLGT
ncbi:antitoxin [Luedemannella helvata]|uniref:Antitoxin n=1 Tax=Luedemannella helvata TaxID=349315 RepID=A0ABN2L890_9ACTN